MSSDQPANVLTESLIRLLDTLEADPIDSRTMNTIAVVGDFAVDSPALTPTHKVQLQDISDFMLNNPEAAIMSLIGRASQTGPERNNDALAFNRAETVRRYLIDSGLAPSRVGAIYPVGARQPLIDAPNREAELNRSVEIALEWPTPVTGPPPATNRIASTDWKLDLILSVTVTGGKMRLPLAGQVQIGNLQKLDAAGTVIETKKAYLFVAGFELGISFDQIEKQKIFVSATTGTGVGGEIYMPTPPGAVDFNWFDGRAVLIAGFSAALGGGGEGTCLMFPTPGAEFPGTFYAQVTTGFAAGAGVSLLAGVLNIEN